MSRFPEIPRRVLVTGCSSGIGAATARALRDEGWDVVPTARKEEDLETLRGDGFDPLALDVADSDSVRAVAEGVLDRFEQDLGGVVNNAGFGQAGAVEDVPRDALRYQFEVNLFGMQELTNRLIPAFRARGRGRIVNVSSVLGRVAMPFNGVYSATKFAMEALSDVMRVELSGSGIAVSLIEPGPITSNFRKTAVEHVEGALNVSDSPFARFYEHELKRRKGNPQSQRTFTLPPEAVAAKIVHALESSRPRRRYCVTVPAYAGAWIRRVAPDALVDRIMERSLKKRLRRVDESS